MISGKNLNEIIFAAKEFQGMYVCPVCGHMYKHEKSLTLHSKYECGKEAQFGCELCPYKAKQKGNLKRHILLKHSSSKRTFSFAFCDIDDTDSSHPTFVVPDNE